MKFRNVTTEVEVKYEVEKDELVERVVEQFIEYARINRIKDLKTFFPVSGDIYENSSIDELKQSKELTPIRINLFLSKLTDNAQKDNNFRTTINRWLAGDISELIQNSYNLGYNNFNLFLDNFYNLEFDHLEGKKENTLKLNVSAISIDSLGAESKNIHYITDSIIETVGGKCNDCTFTLLKDASMLMIYGHTNNCTFRTSNKETYNAIISDLNKNNKVQLIDKKGNIIKENYEIQKCNNRS